MRGFKIGELSRLTGVSTGTIRFYERKGLMPLPSRTTSGYRYYPNESLERLKLVRHIRGLGFSLEEVADLLALADQQSSPCGRKGHCRAAAKLHELDGRIEELKRIRQALAGMLHLCEKQESRCTLLATFGMLASPIGKPD